MYNSYSNGTKCQGTGTCHPKDRYGVWEKHANKGGSGKIMLIDRDGTILSTSNDAQELEPLIKAAIERGK